jgi:hypothetical protein
MPPLLRPLAVAAALAALALTAPVAARAAAPPTTVHASPAELSRLLFVAGDVRRLNRNPSGTVDTVLEHVLQAEYRLDPSLDPATAQSDIDGLRTGLAAQDATSTATLAVEPGNARILAILAALESSHPRPEVMRALAAVADTALTESSTTTRALGEALNPAADAQSTLLYGSFSPASTLEATTRLAAADARFGQARDALWAAAAHESVNDDTSHLLAANPALQNDDVHRLLQGLAPDGSLTISTADVEDLVRQDIDAIDAQNTVAQQAHDAVVQACPGVNCQARRDDAKADDTLARGKIAAEQISVTAAGALLAQIDARFADAVQAEAQAAAQVADGVNSYLAATDYGELLHAASDAAGLVLSLAVAEVNPTAAVTGLVTTTADILGPSNLGPDGNELILEGLQGISHQLSAFAAATSAQFEGLDARLEKLTQDVGTLADRLSNQISEVKGQLDELDTKLRSLQSSVDQLNSEVARLLAQDTRNTLVSDVNQWLGHGGLSESELRVPAGIFFTDATTRAQTEPLLTRHTAFDLDEAGKLDGLGNNLNFFTQFPARVSDALGGPWLTAAVGSCPGGDPGNALCLPDADYWAAASRADAQLLLENRDSVTPDRLDQLDAEINRGRALDDALDRFTADDAHGTGTGNTVLNGALDYYESWVGRDADRPSSAPTLEQVLRKDRMDYLDTQKPSDVKTTVAGAPWIDPAGGFAQSLDGVDQFAFSQFTNIQAGGRIIPDLRRIPSVVNWLPIAIRNAVRLHVAGVRTTLTASWAQGGNPPIGELYPYDATLSFTLTGAGPDIFLGSIHASGTDENCAGGALESIVAGWLGQRSCPDIVPSLEVVVNNPGRFGSEMDTSGFIRGALAVRPLIETELLRLYNGSLNALLGPNGSADSLTRGNHTPDTDAQAAAERVGVAQSFVADYIGLGLPQALATDDTLHGLVAGQAADALLHPYYDANSIPYAPTVPAQVANYIQRVRDDQVRFDPVQQLGNLFHTYRDALQDAIRSYVVTGRATGQTPADGGRLDESNPLVASTVDRLMLTRAVLADRLANPPAAPQPQPQPVTPATPVTPAQPAQPAQPGPVPAAPAAKVSRARLIHRARAHGRTIRLTVGCKTGTCRLTVTAVSGRRSVARRVRVKLRAGARRTVVLHLNAAGRRQLARHKRLRVTVKVAQAGHKRPLSVARVTVR